MYEPRNSQAEPLAGRGVMRRHDDGLVKIFLGEPAQIGNGLVELCGRHLRREKLRGTRLDQLEVRHAVADGKGGERVAPVHVGPQRGAEQDHVVG